MKRTCVSGEYSNHRGQEDQVELVVFRGQEDREEDQLLMLFRGQDLELGQLNHQVVHKLHQDPPQNLLPGDDDDCEVEYLHRQQHLVRDTCQQPHRVQNEEQMHVDYWFEDVEHLPMRLRRTK